MPVERPDPDRHPCAALSEPRKGHARPKQCSPACLKNIPNHTTSKRFVSPASSVSCTRTRQEIPEKERPKSAVAYRKVPHWENYSQGTQSIGSVLHLVTPTSHHQIDQFVTAICFHSLAYVVPPPTSLPTSHKIPFQRRT